MKLIRKHLLLFFAFCCILLLPERSVMAIGSVDLELDGQTWVSQTIREESDIRYYRVVIPSDGKLEMNFQAFRNFTYLHFLDADLMDTSDDRYFRIQINKGSQNAPGSDSYSLYLNKGVYYVKAMDCLYGSFAGEGAVRIKALFTPANSTETEPNNTWTQAMQLPAGNTVRGVLTLKDDIEDFYRFQMTGRGMVTFTLTALGKSMKIQVYTNEYELLEERAVYDGTETAPQVVKLEKTLDPGSYYIKITDAVYQGTTEGIYELKWQAVVPVTGVSLSKSALSVYKGTTATLKATVSPSDATNQTVTWSSSDPSVATVDSKGEVKGISAGSAVITASSSDGTSYSASCTVTVKNPKLSVNKSSVTLYKGKTTTIKTTVKPSATVKYSSSNKKVATVSSKGKITAKAKGSCTITVKANGISKKIKVTVKNPVIKLNKSSVTLKVKKTFTIKATVTPSAKVTFKSSNKKIATVSSKGKITAKKKGSCKITVKANGISKTVKVNVK